MISSITLSPKKTTIFTSAISSTTTALGCDSKILLTTDLSRSEMNSFVTGDPKGGGGAVFALELTRNLVFAGTRKGQVKIVDCRTGK